MRTATTPACHFQPVLVCLSRVRDVGQNQQASRQHPLLIACERSVTFRGTRAPWPSTHSAAAASRPFSAAVAAAGAAAGPGPTKRPAARLVRDRHISVSTTKGGRSLRNRADACFAGVSQPRSHVSSFALIGSASSYANCQSGGPGAVTESVISTRGLERHQRKPLPQKGEAYPLLRPRPEPAGHRPPGRLRAPLSVTRGRGRRVEVLPYFTSLEGSGADVHRGGV